MKWNLAFLLIVFPYYLKAAIQQVGIILQHDQRVSNGVLTEYIKKLHSPKCQWVSQINILYSYQDNFEILNLKQLSNSSEIPLYFDFKPLTENAHRLRIADSSTAELYFIGNYNSSKENCQKIKESLTFAQDHEAAGLIPLVGQIEQTSVITVDNGQKVLERYFGYAHRPQLKHFQIVENIRLISKHILQLAQSNIRQVKLMANHTPICQEIFLNFLQAHFYPELRSRTKAFDNKLVPIDFVRTVPAKTNCIRTFIDILGYCPLYYQKKFFEGKIWKNPNFQQILQLKKVTLNAEILYSTQTRRLFPKQQSSVQEQIESQVFSSSETIILSFLVITIIFMIFSIAVLKSKIEAFSIHSAQGSSVLSQNQC